MSDPKQKGPEGVLTGVNWLTRVNTRCIRKVEKTRVVGFRIPSPLADSYSELPDNAKTTIRIVVASLVYALSKKYGIEVECEEQLKPMLSEVPALGGQIIINANIAEAKPQVSINMNINDIEDIIRLLEYLYNEASKNWDWRTKNIIRQRLQKAQKTLMVMANYLN